MAAVVLGASLVRVCGARAIDAVLGGVIGAAVIVSAAP